MSRDIWILYLLVLTALILSANQPVEAQEQAEACRIGGSWVGSYSGGPWDTPLIFQNTATPQIQQVTD